MRRAPSTRARQPDALRNSVFDAAQRIGLADPNALTWLEHNANISEEDEEEDVVEHDPRPPSATHPPSLVFSSSSSEPDSSVNSPSNDHSTTFRAAYPRVTAQTPPFQLSARESNTPFGLDARDSWPKQPTHLAIASLSPATSRAPTPSEPQPEPRKTRKLTKTPVPDTITRKSSVAGSEQSTDSDPPRLPLLLFPSDTTSDASSAISASSSATVTWPAPIPFPAVDEPRSVFEDDSPVVPAMQFCAKPETAPALDESPSKEARGILRTMRSLKLSLKGQKAPKAPLPEAPPVPSVPSLPPVLTLKLGKDVEGEGRLKVAEMFCSPDGSQPPVACQSRPSLSSDPSQAHAPIRIAGGGNGFWSANVGAKHEWTSQPPPVVRRVSVDQSEPPKKDLEKTRAGTVTKHARTRSKSGDFSGVGWEKPGKPARTGSDKAVRTEAAKAVSAAADKPIQAAGSKAVQATGDKPTRMAGAKLSVPRVKVKRIANPDPVSPKPSIESEGALDVRTQLQSFVASIRRTDDDEDEPALTIRSSGEYDPDPFRVIAVGSSSTGRLFIPASSIPREIGQGQKDASPTGDSNNDASEQWVVPSPSWAPLEPKRDLQPPQPQFLRPDRQRASGLSIPRSVTPDSPRPALPPWSKSLTHLPSVAPLAVGPKPFVPLVSRSLTPQPQPRTESPPRDRQVERQSSSPSRRSVLPARTSSVSSLSSGGHGASVPRIVVPVAPVSGPRSAQVDRSTSITPIARSTSVTPVARSMTPTPAATLSTPRSSEDDQPRPDHKRGRVSPFPMQPVRAPPPAPREKYPGGMPKLDSNPHVRFIGVRSSNGSSQAGWQRRLAYDDDESGPESPEFGYPGWAVDSPASRESTYTTASTYDEEIPPVPSAQRLAAAVRGLTQHGRI